MGEEVSKKTPAEPAVETSEKQTAVKAEASDSAKSKEAASTSTSSDDLIKEELAKTKEGLDGQLLELKKNQKAKDEENEQLKGRLDEISQSFEQLKKKTMTKEELEADEKKQILKERDEARTLLTDIQNQLRSQELSNRRQAIAMKEGIPADLLDMVTGEDSDEIKLNCQKLAKHLKQAATPNEVTENKVIEVGSESVSSSEANKNSESVQSKQPGSKDISFSSVKQRLSANPKMAQALKDRFGMR